MVGITGSVGKTTTKDLLRHCLASTFRTAASERSFNNELGLPLTLLNAPDDAQWVVLEMGARDVGHIARLALVGRPDVGIVTSVAMAHVEFFGGLDGVARAKGELVRALPEHGVAVLNFDDARVAAMASYSPCPVLGYAVEADAEVRAEAVALDDDLRAHFTLVTPWGTGEVRLSLHGLQQVPNALAAASAALWCGVPFDAVLAALAEATGSPFRMEVHRPAGGPLLLADCYNANPASTEAALRTLGLVEAERKLALLGLMAELGAATEAEHLRMASLAEELGIEVVGYQTDLYGEAHVDDVAVRGRAAQDPRSRRCGTGQGEQGGPARGRGGALRVRTGSAVALAGHRSSWPTKRGLGGLHPLFAAGRRCGRVLQNAYVRGVGPRRAVNHVFLHEPTLGGDDPGHAERRRGAARGQVAADPDGRARTGVPRPSGLSQAPAVTSSTSADSTRRPMPVS